jgi:hypothetical protein
MLRKWGRGWTTHGGNLVRRNLINSNKSTQNKPFSKTPSKERKEKKKKRPPTVTHGENDQSFDGM